MILGACSEKYSKSVINMMKDNNRGGFGQFGQTIQYLAPWIYQTSPDAENPIRTHTLDRISSQVKCHSAASEGRTNKRKPRTGFGSSRLTEIGGFVVGMRIMRVYTSKTKNRVCFASSI